MLQKPSIVTVSVVFVLSLFGLATGALAQESDEPTQRRRSERAVQAQMNAAERRERVDQLRQERTTDIQERVAARRAQVRQDVCERRENRISALIPRLANQSTRVLSAIDSVYERVQGFYGSGQLAVENYDELDQAVANAQLAAQSAVQATSGYEFTFDCDNPSVGDQLFGFRESVTDTREELKVYRSELVTLISSLRSAAAEEDTEADEEGGDATDSTEESPSENSDEEDSDA